MLRRNRYSPEEHALREEYTRLALASGRFAYQQRGSKIRCSYCGRKGWHGGSWMDGCLRGHPYVCGCGRVFATRQAISSHRRTHSS